MKFKTIYFLILITLIFGCGENEKQKDPSKVYKSAKPYTRWWWFAAEIKKKDIRHQLEWLREKQFGGVEIAFIYPVNRNPNAKRIEWLSPEWTRKVKYAKKCADSLNLGCDFTFGTLWPFGGTFVADSDRTKIYGDSSFHQPLRLSWTHPDTGNVLDHLDSSAFKRYARTMGQALNPALKGSTSALFCDSWEVETRKIWTDGFAEEFQRRFGYDIRKYMDSIYSEKYSDERYDYMKLVADKVLNNFYKPFTQKCHELGAISRVQCAGSPTDIIRAYANTDVPETEAMLYEPNYSKIVASAAMLSSKKIVSAETFTCLYGWPDKYHLREQTADLKLVADALFANGVNQIFWHGMPYNPAGIDTNYFYATVHAGKKGALSEELGSFNRYMKKVSKIMRKGKTYSDVAVYLPLEDSWYAGEYPKEKQMKWSWGAYELRYQYMPPELEGYHPMWINGHFLRNGKLRKGTFHCGEAQFSALYIDADYMDQKTANAIIKIAKTGFPVCLKKIPKEAGKIKNKGLRQKFKALYEKKNVSKNLNDIKKSPPLLEGDTLPPYYAKMADDNLYLFLGHPKTKNLKYPLQYGQSYTEKTIKRRLTFHFSGNKITKDVAFKPYQSIMLEIDKKGTIEKINIRFQPKIPKRIKQETN